MNNIAERTDAVFGFPVSPAGPATDPSVSTGQYPAPVAATRCRKPTSGSAAGFTTDVCKNKIRKRFATENFVTADALCSFALVLWSLPGDAALVAARNAERGLLKNEL